MEDLKRQHISSGTPWEASVGYSRAVRVGNIVRVAGTLAAEADGTIVAPGDCYQQAKHILAKIEKALNQADAELEHVISTRTYITGPEHAEAFGRAHHEVFAQILPTSTLVVVAGLVGEGAVIEIEAEAIVA